MNTGSVIARFGADVAGFINGMQQMAASTTGWEQLTALAAANAASALGRIPAAVTPMNAAFSQMAATSQSAGSQIQGHFAAMSSSGQSFASRLSGAFSSISSGVSTVTGHIGSMVSSVGSGFVSMGRSVISAVEGFGRFMFFARYAADAAMGFAKALLGQNANMEQSRAAFIGLLGSGQAADAMLHRLWSFAATTPFEFPELVQDTQELMGMGFAARDVVPVLQAVGDAAAGVGRGKEGVDRMTLALGQMQARGKVTGQDMLQLTEAGIPAWKILANAMHLSVDQVQQLSQQGKLGADSVTALWHGMEKMYGGQMARQAQTFNGLLSTLHDNAMSALMTFSGPIFNMAKNALSSLTTLAGSPAFSTFAKTLGQDVAQGISKVVDFIKQAVNWFGQFRPQVDQVKNAFGNLGSALAPVANDFQRSGTASTVLRGALDGLKFVIVAVATIISTLANGLAAAITWIRAGGPVVQFLGGVFNTLAGVITNALLPVWKQMQESWKQLQPAIAPLLPALKVIGEILLGVVVVAILSVLAVLAGLVAGLSRVLVGVMQFVTGVVQFFSGMAQACSGVINFITDLVTGHFERLGADLQEIWQGIALMFQGMWNMIQGIFNAAVMSVVDLISTFISTITSFFEGLYSALVGGSIIPDMCNGILNAFTGMISSVIGAVTGFVSSVVGFFGDLANQAIGKAGELVNGVSGALAGLGGIAASAGRAVIDGLVGAINAGIGWVAGAAQNVASTIASFLPHSPAKEGPLSHLDEFGPALTGGLASGIIRTLPTVHTAVSMMVSPIPAQVTGRVDTGAAPAALATRATAAPLTMAQSGQRGGSSSETNDILRQILRELGHDRGVTQGQIIDALGDALASRVRTHYRR